MQPSESSVAIFIDICASSFRSMSTIDSQSWAATNLSFLTENLEKKRSIIRKEITDAIETWCSLVNSAAWCHDANDAPLLQESLQNTLNSENQAIMEACFDTRRTYYQKDTLVLSPTDVIVSKYPNSDSFTRMETWSTNIVINTSSNDIAIHFPIHSILTSLKPEDLHRQIIVSTVSKRDNGEWSKWKLSIDSYDLGNVQVGEVGATEDHETAEGGQTERDQGEASAVVD